MAPSAAAKKQEDSDFWKGKGPLSKRRTKHALESMQMLERFEREYEKTPEDEEKLPAEATPEELKLYRKFKGNQKRLSEELCSLHGWSSESRGVAMRIRFRKGLILEALEREE